MPAYMSLILNDTDIPILLKGVKADIPGFFCVCMWDVKRERQISLNHLISEFLELEIELVYF